ncbi:MAG: phage portal protein [Ruminococcus sp.]|nr:phage portal protein [Ruminococcus sp.]MBR1752915.1 phage portal protein [Ruminococcus sp.]
MILHGRRIIYVDVEDVDESNVQEILNYALMTHAINRTEIEYLYNYYKGVQPILDRIKQVRPEINNKVVENRANEIVSFKTGYLVGEPLQYISTGTADADSVNRLNEYAVAEGKALRDKELADWFHICGTSYRMVLPDPDRELDESPFEIYTLDPRNTFVVYSNKLGNKPVMGVRYVKDIFGNITYSCYTKTRYFEISTLGGLIRADYHVLGEIPIIEYPLNMARLGAFEIVIPLLDAINLTESDALNNIEQIVQSLLLFHNTDISSEDYEQLRDQGAIKFKDIDPQTKAEIKYITCQLNAGETQQVIDRLYESVLTICGMPNRNTGNGDNGIAVVYRDGWSAAETRAKDTEPIFKASEQVMLKILINICNTFEGMDLKVSGIDIRFTRRNYENILQKAQVLDLMLKNEKIAPQLAFEYCGMFADPGLAYKTSEEYYKREVALNGELVTNDGDSQSNRNDLEARQSS